jgi:hypothetical protein
MAAKVTVTRELIETLRDAQLRHLRDGFLVEEKSEKDPQGIYSGIGHSKWSDDGYDYLRGALNLSSALVEAYFEDNVDMVTLMLDPESDEYIPHNYATDGICNEVWAVLPSDEDGDVVI